MRIFLVRHGQTQSNVENRLQGSKGVPLNQVGEKQVAEVAQFFKNIPLTAVYSAPARRAKQTASSIAKFHNLSVKVIRGFRERSHGKLEGKTEEQRKKLIPDIQKQWKHQGIDWRPPGGETLRELQQRAIKAFNQIIKKHKLNDTILVASHGGTIKAVVHYVHGGKLEDYLHAKPIENTQIIEIEYDGNKARIA